jgi:glycerol-3-phosphate O-acyltransferase
MVVEAALDDDGKQARRAQVVPISIGYEKVIEEKSYARELAGGEKKKEDVRGLLRATRVLRGNYGRLNIQFDEPFELGTQLRDDGALVAWDEEENVVVPSDGEARRRATERLAHRVVWGINHCTAVTPTALTAAALLASGRRGVARHELLEGASFLLGRARAAGGRLSPALSNASGALNLDAIDRAIDLLAGDGDLTVRSGSGTLPGGERPLDEIYVIPDERRPQLAFYRNNAVHLFVAEGLVTLALDAATRTAGGAERIIARNVLRDRTLDLSRLLKREFSYRVGETFEQIFETIVGQLEEAGLLEPETIGDSTPALRAARLAELRLLAGQVRDFVDAYWIVARTLETLTSPIGEKELLRRIRDRGEKLVLTGELPRSEACVDANYQNALALFTERRLLVAEDKRLRLTQNANLRALIEELEIFRTGP